jgi:DNA replication and repair protein RecF
MYLSRLTLQNYRNYAALELDLAPGVAIFLGDNAQGKTNLLEAIYLLATTRGSRGGSDLDLIRWGAIETESPAARISGHARRRQGDVEVTVAVGVARPAPATNGQHGHASKRLQVNGVSRRASEVVGQIAAVLFTAQDIDLLTGPPALRRRYLDMTISQVNPLYLRALQRYSRVLLQRNSLLKRVQEGAARPDQLAFWDQELVAAAAFIAVTRAQALTWLAAQAGAFHAQLSGGSEQLAIAYQPQLPPTLDASALALDAAQFQALLLQGLRAGQRREIDAGASLYGPHRDDVNFTVDGAAVGSFGSRAQQRTAALALRLAEMRYIEAESGDKPILLLDDILSELDERRRRSVMDALRETDQILVTATEADRFDATFLAEAHRYRVAAGHVGAEAPSL